MAPSLSVQNVAYRSHTDIFIYNYKGFKRTELFRILPSCYTYYTDFIWQNYKRCFCKYSGKVNESQKITFMMLRSGT